MYGLLFSLIVPSFLGCFQKNPPSDVVPMGEPPVEAPPGDTPTEPVETTAPTDSVETKAPTGQATGAKSAEEVIATYYGSLNSGDSDKIINIIMPISAFQSAIQCEEGADPFGASPETIAMMEQKSHQKLRDFVKRFREDTLTVEILSQSVRKIEMETVGTERNGCTLLKKIGDTEARIQLKTTNATTNEVTEEEHSMTVSIIEDTYYLLDVMDAANRPTPDPTE